jgi:hypothetical protein
MTTMRVVISQSMYFPWVGFLEQILLADVFVLYDDVQFSKGSFTNRVQIKTATGSSWLTLPLSGLRLGQKINEVQLNNEKNWRRAHRDKLHQAYSKAPFLKEMLDLVDRVFAEPCTSLSELSYRSIFEVAKYFDLTVNLVQFNSVDLGVAGGGSQRVLDIMRRLGGDTYITGHGAKKYLDHQAFEKNGIDVRYMNYQCVPYPQLYGKFTPYVSSLDLIANCGLSGIDYLQPKTLNWKEYFNEFK